MKPPAAKSSQWTSFSDTAQKRIQAKLEHILPSNAEPQKLYNAMRYAVLSGGKRIRPLLVYATGQTLGGKLEVLDYPAAAVEMIHCYSLIHDDLPAMDDDIERRGRPTCHIAFDEATAILAGDALQSMAFELLAKYHPSIKQHLQLQMIQILAHTIGPQGMAGGQILDLANDHIETSKIETIHHMKTAALFSACVRLGALAAGHDNVLILNPLEQFATALGIAFQIQDDLQDAHEKDQQTSYLNTNTIETAKNRIAELYGQAINAVKQLPCKTSLLIELIDYLSRRQ